MKRLVISTVCIFTILISGCKTTNIEGSVDKVINSCCFIEVTSDTGNWSGSGVLIGEDVILTAGHVIEDANEINITFTDGTKVAGKTFVKVDDMDLGLIIIDPVDNNKPVKINFEDELVLCQKVFSVSHPFGYDTFVSFGKVGNIGSELEDEYLSYMNMFGAPGSSGGPVFNIQGELVAIIVAGPNRVGASMTFCIPMYNLSFVMDY